MTVANLSIALILSTVLGAFTGLLLGGVISDPYLAIIAGFLATIVVGNAHNIMSPQLAVIFSAIGSRVHLRPIICSVLASLAGGAVAIQVARVSELTWPVMVGALAGLFAGILMALFMTLYGTISRPAGRSRPNP